MFRSVIRFLEFCLDNPNFFGMLQKTQKQQWLSEETTLTKGKKSIMAVVKSHRRKLKAGKAGRSSSKLVSVKSYSRKKRKK